MDWFAWLLALTLKGAIVLATARVAARALRRSSAAARHLVWSAAFAAMLVAAAASLPTREVTISTDSATRSEPAAGEGRGTPVEVPPPPDSVWGAWVVGIWLAGAILAAARLIFSLVMVDGLAVRPALESDWYVRLQRLRRTLGIRRDVELLVSPDAPMPMTWGAIRPVVILPSSAARWSGGQLDPALLHELAHVKRWDWLTQLGAHLACAVYWFLPLCWSALGEFRKERERACDDVVLRLGARATDYAGHLLQAARAMQRHSWSTALAMAQESHLENRVAAMLDASVERRPLGWIQATGALLATAALSIPLAAISAGGAKVEGVILDPSGAVVPGATVALAGNEWRYTTRSGPDGAFRFARVPRGRYEFHTSHPGFRRFRRGELVLASGATYRIRPTLQIGTIRESVRVAAVAE